MPIALVSIDDSVRCSSHELARYTPSLPNGVPRIVEHQSHFDIVRFDMN
jgi:hypothetical protein